MNIKNKGFQSKPLQMSPVAQQQDMKSNHLTHVKPQLPFCTPAFPQHPATRPQREQTFNGICESKKAEWDRQQPEMLGSATTLKTPAYHCVTGALGMCCGV